MSDPPARASGDRLLTVRQQRFVAEFLVDEVAAAAARRAGYSPKASLHSGHQLMRNPRVLAAIAAAKAARDAPMTREKAIEALRRIAEANVLDYARPGAGGALELDIWRLERDRAGAVRELTVTEKTDPKSGVVTRTVGFKLADRAAALVKLLPLLRSEVAEEVAGKAWDKGYVEGMEDAFNLDEEEFANLRAYRDDMYDKMGERRARTSLEHGRRMMEFREREMAVQTAPDWVVASSAEIDRAGRPGED